MGATILMSDAISLSLHKMLSKWCNYSRQARNLHLYAYIQGIFYLILRTSLRDILLIWTTRTYYFRRWVNIGNFIWFQLIGKWSFYIWENESQANWSDLTKVEKLASGDLELEPGPSTCLHSSLQHTHPNNNHPRHGPKE